MLYPEGSYKTVDVTKDSIAVFDENELQNEEDEEIEDQLGQEEVLGVLEVSLQKDKVEYILLVF